MKFLKIVFFTLVIFTMLAACAPAAPAVPAATQAPVKKLSYCYITPGPDTWYKRDVEGFQYGAGLDGVDVVVVNSEYDVEKELANIDFCINQGVDGISVFSFHENGARI